MKNKSKNTEYKSPVNLRGILTKSEKNNSMKRFLTVLLVVLSFSAFGQQDPLFSQYMFNKLLVNPAYAGSRENLSIDLLDRYQWVGIEGAPNTITLAAHALLESKKIGLGMYVFRDELGPTVNQGLMATYAYRIQTQKGWFSFGIQGGIKYFNFDWNAINTRDPDYMFYPQDVERITPDVNLGIYYQTPRFFAGLSSKQLLENEYGVGEVEGRTTFSRLSRHYYAMTGMAFPLNDKIVFRPSMLGKFVRNAPLQMDFNASFLFSDLFWIGASYRTEKAVIFLTEFRITDFLRIGYSFDLYLNELQLHNKGSHEFRLGFDIDLRKSRMKTPRYF